ncbi:hypothetical protein DAI22_04g270300 [Oryza sativa Japonica Group]|nr:hypothetical protein DAI22_04g270300 [Oryza sativa Japonica Group]
MLEGFSSHTLSVLKWYAVLNICISEDGYASVLLLRYLANQIFQQSRTDFRSIYFSCLSYK